jgi:hypothetical protein
MLILLLVLSVLGSRSMNSVFFLWNNLPLDRGLPFSPGAWVAVPVAIWTCAMLAYAFRRLLLPGTASQDGSTSSSEDALSPASEAYVPLRASGSHSSLTSALPNASALLAPATVPMSSSTSVASV